MNKNTFRWILIAAAIVVLCCFAALIFSMLGGEATVSNRCVQASQQQLEWLRIAIKSTQNSNDISSGWAVKSEDFSNVWMVAAEITGPGLEPKQAIGVWALNGDMESPLITYSVNHVAESFSGFRLGSDTDINLDMNSDGAQEAENCAKNK